MALDPAKHLDMTEIGNILTAYDPLVFPVFKEAPEPWIAESWEISEDGTTYTFHIRKGIKFQDGTELTAEDVAFSMRRVLRLGLGYSYLWADSLEPEDVEVTDEYTVVFHLKEPYAPFLSTFVQFFIVNKDLVIREKKPGEFGEFGDYGQKYLETHTAGSGAYMVESVTLGDRIHFVKFEDYWRGWEENQIDDIYWLVIPEQATIKMMMLEGTADICSSAVLPEIQKLLGEAPGIDYVEFPSVKTFFTHMNNQKPPLDDVNVRKAISYAIDYEALTTVIFPGSQAVGPVPPGVAGHNPDVVVYSRDLEKAKQYLEKSKYSLEELKEMKLNYVAATGIDMFKKTALLFKDNLKDIGLNVEIQAETWGRLCDMATTPETSPHMCCMWLSITYPSADRHTTMIYTPRVWGTYSGMSWYDNPKVVELLNQARVTIDSKERFRLYGEAQRIIAEDAASVFMTNPPMSRCKQTYIKGFTNRGAESYDLYFHDLKIEK